jgi:CTP:molybdopterin cytidylyltransferase MocA
MGARAILRNHPNMLRTVECEAASIDIDTPEDLEALASGNDA